MRATVPTFVTTLGAACVSLALAACGGKEEARPDSAAPATTPSAAGSSADTAVRAGGNGVPSGFMGAADPGDPPITDAKYTPGAGGAWDVRTGPHHILYQAKDTASGSYVVTARVDQVEAPSHPESFGVFIGGQNLGQPNQKYTYFMVRHTGDVLVKQWDGSKPKDIVSWKPSPAVPKADASGKGSYRMQVRVGTDSVRFFVNDQPAAAIAASAASTSGVAGVRIGHNLHLLVEPVRIEK